jgi:hypothetical protein
MVVTTGSSSSKDTASNSSKDTTSSSNQNLLNDLIKKVAQSSGSVQSKGAVYTQQEADYTVQNVAQQLLGRSLIGLDYNKAIKIAMAQSQDTSIYGRQQAVENYLMSTPEYQAREENKYLDAIYNEVAKNVQKASV